MKIGDVEIDWLEWKCSHCGLVQRDKLQKSEQKITCHRCKREKQIQIIIS